MIATKFFPRISLALLALVNLTSCDIAQNRVKGSGNVVKEQRQISSFHQLKVLGSMDVELTQGTSTSAAVEADDNILPLIELKEEGDQLVVRIKKGYNVSNSKRMVVYLTTNEIEAASMAGSGDLKIINKFNSDREVKFGLSGSGNITGAINAPAVRASIAGSGDITLNGETKDLSVSIAGSGNYHGYELMAENATVKIAGSGDVDLFASVKLDAKIAGSGNVNYKGTPQISTHIAGSGTVSQK
ncbi:head GIN domain-containing protein [Chitinophaga silvatica]|nr:head GIN domain-containing protein [Chitinophaga silvatica]